MLISILTVLFFLLFLPLFLLIRFLNKSLISGDSTTSSYDLPPQPSGSWPIIGHLPILNPDTHLAHTFGQLADKYGPIFTLNLGMQRAVVVSSREAVMECFTVNDKSFANRPRNSVGEHLAYDHASFGFSNGPYWREMRKIVVSEVLSPQRLEAMRGLRVSEIETSVRELYAETTKRVDGLSSSEKVVVFNMSRWTEQVALNIIVKTIAGKRYVNDGIGKEDKEVGGLRKLFRELTLLSGEFVLSDVIPIPFLKWLDVGGHIKRMKRASKELDEIIEKWIDEHVERRAKGDQKERDFIDVLLSKIDDDKLKNYGASRMTIIKATVVNVVLGGFDTTSVYLTWLLALLINNKNVMKLAQQELDTKIGKQRWVEESDFKNLPYLQAIIKETLRLYPPLPLSLPHQAVEDCRIGGYLIPKGTLLFVNLLKLQRDPRYWSDPDKFMPERFMTKRHAGVDVTGQQFEYIPFGSGRRLCPGITFVMQVTNLVVARLLQGFDFGDRTVDMEEGVGITMPRANPVEVVITPRLNSQLYDQTV